MIQRLLLVLACCAGSLTVTAAPTTPPQNIHPGSASVRLDSSFDSDAWLVYTYDVDAGGGVVNATIRASNGVLDVEQAVLRQLKAMRFKPASRGGEAVTSSEPPVTYTWILDVQRQMSPRFAQQYGQAWDAYAAEDYSSAADIAVLLRDYPGRNALEEVKARLLSASLAGKVGDSASELVHLERVLELQNLAIDNDFSSRYVPTGQYQQVLKRVQELQQDNGQLADAAATLRRIRSLDANTGVAAAASESYRAAENALRARPVVETQGELQGLYPGSAGSWQGGLFRRAFSLADVSGSIDAIFLLCGSQEMVLRYPAAGNWLVPPGWDGCEIEITGQAGTRFSLRQVNP